MSDTPAFIYSDSLQAFQRAYPGGPPPGSTVLSSAPAVLMESSLGARPFTPADSASAMAAIDLATRKVSASLYRELQDSDSREFALTAARWALRSQLLLYRAASLRSEYLTDPMVIIQIDVGAARANSVYNGDLARLFVQNPHLSVRPVHVPEVADAHPPDPGWLHRVRGVSIQALGYKAALALGRFAGRLGRQPHVAIVRECELLRETVFHLALRGVIPGCVTLPTPRGGSIDDERVRRTMNVAETAMAGITGDILEACQWQAVRPVLSEQLKNDLARYVNACGGWMKQLKSKGNGKGRIILSNALATPEMEALHTVCDRHGHQLIMFQHGVTAEICPRIAEYEALSEIAGCRMVLTFNAAAARLHNRNSMRAGVAKSIGAPGHYRKRPGSGRERAPIWYISTALYTGHWGLLHKGVADIDLARREIAIIDDVLARLPHRVVFKPYPGNRYPDPDPIQLAAARRANIDVETRRIDLRYLIRKARILVTSHATSTLGWALMSGRPVVYLEKPDEVPFDPAVRSLAEDAFFFFDFARPDAAEKTRAFLAQPIEAIEASWREKEPARRSFMRQFIDEAPEAASPGAIGAKTILRHFRAVAELAEDRP